MLAAQGIVGAADADEISGGLDRIAAEYEAHGVPENLDLEDIHMTVEARLTELIGPVAGRLHTARSRNDQVATDFRLWVRGACEEVDAGLAAFQRALLARGEEHAGTVMPGFTHLQAAQPVTLGHHLMAYHEMARRDRSRFADAKARARRVPARQRCAGRHRLRSGPRPHRQGARFRAAHRQFARRRVGPRFRARLSDGGHHRRAASLAAGRRVRDLGEPALWLRKAVRRVQHRQLDHAAKAQPPTPPSWCAAMRAASRAACRRW